MQRHPGATRGAARVQGFFDRRRIATLALAGAGGALFWWAGLPLPMMLGPVAVCLVAGLAGMPMRDTGGLGVFMRTFLGVAVGSSITPALVAELPDMILSLAMVPLFIAAIGAIGYPLFRYGFRYDHGTAWYAAMPGGLQDMIIFGDEAGGNVRSLSLIHATRVVAILTVAPFLLMRLWDLDLTQPPGQAASATDPWQIGLMVVAALAGWKLAERAGLFGASILGPMIVAGALSLSGLLTLRPPAEIIWAAQLFLGVGVGVRYVGVTLRELRRDVLAGLLYSLIIAAISLAFIELVILTGIAPGLEAFLAFLPGGQAEMVVIAIIAGADLAYVVSHHLLRMVLVITLSPLVGRLFNR